MVKKSKEKKNKTKSFLMKVLPQNLRRQNYFLEYIY